MAESVSWLWNSVASVPSVPHLLSQSEEFVLYPPHGDLAGRRPDELRIFLALETSECTV